MGMWWPTGILRALTGIQSQLTQLNAKVDHMSDQQAELDTDVQALTAAFTDVATQTTALGTDLTAVAAEIAALQQQITTGQPVNLDSLNALVASAVSTQQGLDAVVATATGMVPSSSGAPAA